MDWSLQTSQADGMAFVTPSGELDLVTAPLLTRALRTAEAQEQPAIRLDLSGVSFMDSSGLAVVLEAVQRSREHRIELSIIAGRGVVPRVFALAGLLDELPLVEVGG